ncbi:MAG: uroporphyrinogen-III synthase [Oxalobacteraceae bacterium]|nr:uroporphyrinogen-III synthase [Oxalobacteraceae bacterium]
MSKPVVITRPIAQAAGLAQQVKAIGRNAVVFPLLEIHPLPDTTALQAMLADLTQFSMVAFVSPNAIHAAFSHLSRWPAEVAIAVVGEGSRAALAEHGVNDANATIYCPRDPLRTDSQTLLEVLDIEALRGSQVLIVRGESGRELLADALRQSGASVTQVAAYRRTKPQLNAAVLAQLQTLLDAECDWIITSSEALRILLAMIERIAGMAGVVKIQQQHLIVPHSRIAAVAENLRFNNVTLTGSGDERLLAALQSSHE